MNSSARQLLWLILFSIAMGFLEAVVVIYLRELYYPNGFGFPLTVMDPKIGFIEILREGATVVMLLGVGILAGRTLNQRLAFFVAAFAIWDLFYYVFLKLLIGWPPSWFTWDVLFLIPVPWIGPVLSPCLVCITMLLFATALYIRDSENTAHRFSKKEWTWLLVGAFVVVLSWTKEFFQFTSTRQDLSMLDALSFYVPQTYNWWLFGLGEVLMLTGIAIYWKRTATH